MDRSIDRDKLCFCCGADNKRGLHLAITYPEKGAAETSLEVPGLVLRVEEDDARRAPCDPAG